LRYQASDQLYQIESRPAARLQLQNQEQNQAEQQLGKLALVGTLPAIGALIGTALMLGLLIQWVNKGHQSWLMQNAGTGWEIPWTGEIVWQVLVVGFFFVGQAVLPLLLGSHRWCCTAPGTALPCWSLVADKVEHSTL